MMETFYNAEGFVVLDTSDQELHMSREEAESLFVMLGHTLQDMDVNYYSNENGEETPQPSEDK